MRHIGKVVRLERDRAFVRFERTKACENCGACMYVGDKEAEVSLENILHAEVGDYVQVEMQIKGFLHASFLAYIVPLCMLLVGIVLGSLWSDAWGAVLGIAGAGLAYLLLRLLEPKFAKMKKFVPNMVEIEPPFTQTTNDGGNE